MHPVASNQAKLFFIGRNHDGQFGINNKNLKQLTPSPNQSIQKIFVAFGYCIYATDEYQYLWSAGRNRYGQCAIGNYHPEIKQYTLINYFNKHQINIKKICVNVTGNCTFFISDRNKLYASGCNNDGKLGWKTEHWMQCKPKLIKQLTNVIDVQNGFAFSVCLCGSNYDEIIKILQYWSRIYRISSTDVIELILLFTTLKNAVYSTTKNYGSGHVYADKTKSWNEIAIFKKKIIVKIATGYSHSLFLEHNGTLWSCGENYGGALGLKDVEHRAEQSLPRKIEHFVNNRIKICDIQCGNYHNLAIDNHGNIYSWGRNKEGQCGHGVLSDMFVPKLIDFFKNNGVDRMRCGYEHSFVKTIKGECFLFGSNYHYECIAFDDRRYIKIPRKIDEIVKEILDIDCIVDVLPGYYNTAIVCFV